MTQSTDTSLPPDSLESIADNKVVRNTVFAGSAAIALGTAIGSVWQEFYREIVRVPPFSVLHEKRDTFKGIIRNAMDRERITPEVGNAVLHNLDRKYTTAFGQALEKQGIATTFVKGTLDRYKQLGTFDKGAIAMKTGASLAITLGGYYLINQNVRMKANNKHQDDKLSELRQRIDAQGDRQIEAYERAAR